VTWHGRGDYAATVMPDGANRSVLIHQMSTRRSQLPFAKSKGLVQSVLFHPIRPFLFVAVNNNLISQLKPIFFIVSKINNSAILFFRLKKI